MKYTKVVLMVGHGPEADTWDCGCDQTFGISYLHKPEEHQYVIDHNRGFIKDKDVERLKTQVFDEGGGI